MVVAAAAIMVASVAAISLGTAEWAWLVTQEWAISLGTAEWAWLVAQECTRGAATAGVEATGVAETGAVVIGMAAIGTTGMAETGAAAIGTTGMAIGMTIIIMTPISSLSVPPAFRGGGLVPPAFRGGGGVGAGTRGGAGAIRTMVTDMAAMGTATAATDTGMVTMPMVMGRPVMITDMATRLGVTTAAITAARATEMNIPPIQEWPSCNAVLRGPGITLALLMESWGLQPGKRFTLSSATMVT